MMTVSTLLQCFYFPEDHVITSWVVYSAVQSRANLSAAFGIPSPSFLRWTRLNATSSPVYKMNNYIVDLHLIPIIKFLYFDVLSFQNYAVSSLSNATQDTVVLHGNAFTFLVFRRKWVKINYLDDWMGVASCMNNSVAVQQVITLNQIQFWWYRVIT